MIKELISALVEGRDLSIHEASGAMQEMMDGEATPSQVSAFLTALRIKGETADEVAGLAGVMREKSLKVDLSVSAIDIVGTGGDGSGSFNISTAAAIVVAGTGVRVAKHGNRAASSTCGSADVLEALGVKIDLSPDGVKRCIEECGIGFMFAQAFHPAMKYVGPTRREIGIRTVFNILGPLTNPAGVKRLVLGAPGEAIAGKLANVLCKLGTERALVIHGKDGLDEISVSDATLVLDVNGNSVSRYEVTPEDFGCQRAAVNAVCGGSPADNAAIMQELLSGATGPVRDAVIINAAAGLIVAGVTDDKIEAAKLSKESIDSGKAKSVLEAFIELSNRLV